MAIRTQSFSWDKDFERTRTFLADLLKSPNSFGHWVPSRLDNIRFGPCGTDYTDADIEGIRIWETVNNSEDVSTSKIVAIAIPESALNYYLHTHSEYRFLDEEIVQWIVNKGNQVKQKNQDAKINIFAIGTDEILNEQLSNQGFRNLGLYAYNRTRPLTQPDPEYTLPNGFKIRHVEGIVDYPNVLEVLGSVFPHCKKMTEKRFKLFTSASFYQKDLDLVVVAPDETFAAFCTVRLDPESRIGEFEPVGTHPNYRKLGLGKALLCEGLQRLRKYDPTMVCISGAATTEAANRLYDSIGFTEKVEVLQWQKVV